jgi:hypothetical protein
MRVTAVRLSNAAQTMSLPAFFVADLRDHGGVFSLRALEIICCSERRF